MMLFCLLWFDWFVLGFLLLLTCFSGVFKVAVGLWFWLGISAVLLWLACLRLVLSWLCCDGVLLWLWLIACFVCCLRVLV